MIPLFLPSPLSSSEGTFIGMAALTHYKYEKGQLLEDPEGYVVGRLYQMSEKNWERSDKEFSGERVGVLLSFWGEKTPAEVYL